MVKALNAKERKSVVKRTSQGGGRPKTSGFNKTKKRNIKMYRGQGR
jgi:hypothetical protein